MSSLLVSVRNAEEADLALQGGAGLIDIKEPAAGSLGRASLSVSSAILLAMPRTVPISAALGELRDWKSENLPPSAGLTYLKWGLAEAPDDWAERLLHLRRLVETSSPCRVVYVSYVDYRRALAPSPAQVAHQVVHDRGACILLDTWRKDGSTLLDWTAISELSDLMQHCKAAGARVALAGSLGRQEITHLLRLQPDWFAVRSAVCEKSNRTARLVPERVRQLSLLIRGGG